LHLQESGQLAQAEALYRQLIAEQPSDPVAYNNLGNVLSARTRFDVAVPCYQTAIKLRPHFPDACTNMGSPLKALVQFDQA
jgi:Flp pilus assembly protein TadD